MSSPLLSPVWQVESFNVHEAMTAAPRQLGYLLPAPGCSLSWTFTSGHNPAAVKGAINTTSAACHAQQNAWNKSRLTAWAANCKQHFKYQMWDEIPILFLRMKYADLKINNEEQK